jgi:hypothetical protein
MAGCRGRPDRTADVDDLGHQFDLVGVDVTAPRSSSCQLNRNIDGAALDVQTA